MGERRDHARLVERHGRREVPGQDLALRIAGCERLAVRRRRHVPYVGLVPPELRELAVSPPPEMAPGEVTRVESAGVRLDVVKDVLRQLDLAGVESPPREPEVFGVMVAVSETLALCGDKAMLRGFERVLVGSGDLDLETLV